MLAIFQTDGSCAFFFLLFGSTTLDEDSDADKSPAPFTKRAKIANLAVYYSLHVVKQWSFFLPKISAR